MAGCAMWTYQLQSAVSGNNLLVCWEGGSDWRTTPHKTATPRSGQEPEAARAHTECATGACPHQHPSMPMNVNQQPTAGHTANKQDVRLQCSFFSRAELKSAGGAALQHRKSLGQTRLPPVHSPGSSTWRSLLAPLPPAASSSTPGFSQSGSDSCSTRGHPHPGQGHSSSAVAKLRGKRFLSPARALTEPTPGCRPILHSSLTFSWQF